MYFCIPLARTPCILLNVVFELKFLDVFMGPDDPTEFDNLLLLHILFPRYFSVRLVFCWGYGRNVLQSFLFLHIYLFKFLLIHLFWLYSKTCLKRNAIVPVFFSVFTGFRFTKGCVLIKQSTKNMIAYDYNEGII